MDVGGLEAAPLKEIEPSWGGDWPEVLTTMVLAEEEGRTTLVVRVLSPSKEARDRALETGMKEGWSISYDRLDDHLRSMD